MADKSMKSVIYAEMDTSGITRGVAKTTAELGKLNKTARTGAMAAGVTAGLQAAQGAYTLISRVIDQIDRRYLEIQAMAVKFSPEASAAKSRLTGAETMASIDIGKAAGPGVAADLASQQKTLEDRARAAREDPGGLAAGEASYGILKASAVNAGVTFGEAAMKSIGDPWNEQGPISAMLDQAQTFEYLFGSTTAEDMAGGVGSARGMPYDTSPRATQGMSAEQTEYLRQIANSLKSGAQ